MAYRPEGDKPGANLPFPPMPSAWKEPTSPSARNEPTSGPRPGAPPPREHPFAPREHPFAPRGPLPPRPAMRPMSPIAYPGLPASAPPYPYLVPYPDGRRMSSRSSTVAGLLQMFLFPFAVGRFYTGHVAIALAQILVAWGILVTGLFLGLFLFFLPMMGLVGFLWPFIDGITLLTGHQDDAEGNPLRP